MNPMGNGKYNDYAELNEFYHMVIESESDEEETPAEAINASQCNYVYSEDETEDIEIQEFEDNGEEEIQPIGPSSFEVTCRLLNLVNQSERAFADYFASVGVDTLCTHAIEWQAYKALEEANPDFDFNFVSNKPFHPGRPFFGALYITKKH